MCLAARKGTTALIQTMLDRFPEIDITLTDGVSWRCGPLAQRVVS